MVTACVLEWLCTLKDLNSIKTLRLSRHNSSFTKSGYYLQGASLYCWFNLVGFPHGMAWSCFELAAGQERHCESPLVCSSCSVSLIRVISALVFLYHSGKIRAIFWCYFLRKKKVNCLGSLGKNSRDRTKILSTYLIAGILGNKPGPKLCDSPQKPIIWKHRLWKLIAAKKENFPQLSGRLWQCHVIETGTCWLSVG